MNSRVERADSVESTRVGRPFIQSTARMAWIGLKSGLIATAVMTAFRMPISRSPPPTANFWSTYIAGGDPTDHTTVGLILHLAYGTGAGALFAVASPTRPSGSAVTDESRGVLIGLAYGMLLSVFGERVLLERLLGLDLDPNERFIFHVSHVVYGLTLGAWYGSRID